MTFKQVKRNSKIDMGTQQKGGRVAMHSFSVLSSALVCCHKSQFQVTFILWMQPLLRVLVCNCCWCGKCATHPALAWRALLARVFKEKVGKSCYSNHPTKHSLANRRKMEPWLQGPLHLLSATRARRVFQHCCHVLLAVPRSGGFAWIES